MSDPFFDQGILADWLRGHGPAAAELARYRRHRISRITWAAILAAEPLETRGTLQQLLAPFDVVEVDGRIAASAADITHRMAMNLMQALVLATAQVSGGILITRNTTDYPANMPGIRVPYIL